MKQYSVHTKHACTRGFGQIDRDLCTIGVRELRSGESLIDEEGYLKPATFSFRGRYCRDTAATFGGGAISSAIVSAESAAMRIGQFRTEHVISDDQDKVAIEAMGLLMRAAATIDYESVETATILAAEDAVIPAPAVELQPLA